jgi:hypothetical protein
MICQHTLVTMTDKKLTLNQTIARYYQLGKTPITYISNNATEVMMTLYLPIQHGLHDPDHDELKEDYKKYGNTHSLRQKTVPHPNVSELRLVFDRKYNLISSNQDDYFAEFYWRLRSLIEANPGRKVACTFNSTITESELAEEGHCVIVVYDPAMNTLEFMDSNNLPKHRVRVHRAYSVYCEISIEIMRKVAAALPSVPLYINNRSIYTGYEWGIQSMEASSEKHTETEKEGFCLMWAILLGDLALAFPEEPMSHIIESLKKKSKSKQNSSETENDYLLQVIRGYVVHINKQLEVAFDDDTSKHEACVRLVSYTPEI